MRLAKNPLLRFLGAAHVEAYRNIPLLVLLLALYLVVTELLPGAREAFHAGSWIYLAKTGLYLAVPQIGTAAVLLALGAGGAVAAGAFVLLRRKLSVWMAAVWSLAVFAVVCVFAWVSCGALSGWDPSDADAILHARGATDYA